MGHLFTYIQNNYVKIKILLSINVQPCYGIHVLRIIECKYDKRCYVMYEKVLTYFPEDKNKMNAEKCHILWFTIPQISFQEEIKHKETRQVPESMTVIMNKLIHIVLLFLCFVHQSISCLHNLLRETYCSEIITPSLHTYLPLHQRCSLFVITTSVMSVSPSPNMSLLTALGENTYPPGKTRLGV